MTNKQTTQDRVLLGNSSSVNYEIPQILWDPDSSLPPSQQPEPNKSRPRSPILCLKIHFNTSPCICKDLPSSLPPLEFPTKTLYEFLFSFCWSLQWYLVVTPLKICMFISNFSKCSLFLHKFYLHIKLWRLSLLRKISSLELFSLSKFRDRLIWRFPLFYSVY